MNMQEIKTHRQPAVSIVIPNYNGKQFLETCLSSIQNQSYPACQVVVVDNGSKDGSVEYIRKHYPNTRLIVFEKNKGFCTAVNAGIQADDTPFVFLLNNDTELPGDCLAELVAAAQSYDDDFFSPRILSFHNRDILDGAGDGILRGGAGYRIGCMEKDGEYYDQAGQVFGACGGAAFYRRNVFNKIGLFDDDFFAYSEDVDLNLRANRSGCTCRYVPAAKVFHIGSATTGSRINAFTIKLSTRNNLSLLLKNYPVSLLLRFAPAICIFQFFWFLFAIKNKQLGAYASGVIEFMRSFSSLLGKRKRIRNMPGISNRQFAERIIMSEKDVLQSIMRKRNEQGRSNSLYNIYCRLFL